MNTPLRFASRNTTHRAERWRAPLEPLPFASAFVVSLVALASCGSPPTPCGHVREACCAEEPRCEPGTFCAEDACHAGGPLYPTHACDEARQRCCGPEGHCDDGNVCESGVCVPSAPRSPRATDDVARWGRCARRARRRAVGTPGGGRRARRRVLDRDEVRLALEVRVGEERAVRRAIELAAMVIATGVRAADGKSGRSA